jgi:hypothetical protein
LIRRALIALTALAMVLALAVPAFAQVTNTATSAPVGQTAAIAQVAEQCVNELGNNECVINDNGNGNDGDVNVWQENFDNVQNAEATGGTGGDNNAFALAVGDDYNGDGGENGDDNVAAFNQQLQCQPATASNQIENDASVQVDTILSNSNAGDAENIGNVCQNSAAVAQQQYEVE